MSRDPLHRKYSGTFFIFPVFLPLAELLPWLLSVIAAGAGALHWFSHSFWKSRGLRIALRGLSIACIVGAGWLVAERWLYTPPVEEGSVAVLQTEYSKLETLGNAPANERTEAAKQFGLLWSVATEHMNMGKPLVVDGVLMAGTYEGTLDAASITKGEPLWSLHKKEQIFSTPLVAGNRAYIGEGHHTSPASVLTAFEWPTGKPVWERKFRSHLESYPAINEARDTLFVTAGETGLWALNTGNGEVRWWNKLGHSDIPPLYSDRRLFVVAREAEDKDGALWQEIEASTGKALHTTRIAGNPMCNMLSRGGDIYFATATGQVGVKRETDKGWAHAVSREGVLRWSRELPAMPMPEGAISADGSMLYYTLNDGQLLALRSSDGVTVWQASIGTTINTDMAVIDDIPRPLVAAVSNDGYFTLRRAQTGEEVRHEQIEKSDTYPLYHDKVLYIVGAHSIRAYGGLEYLP